MKYSILKPTFLILFVFIFNIVQSQQTAFQLTLYTTGQDNVLASIENSAGNFILATESLNNLTGLDINLIEISPTGVVIQSKTITMPEHEFVKSVFETSDGHYILTGSIMVSSNNSDWMILKFDASFNLIWYKTYGAPAGGNDYANNGFEISPGHYAITGTVALGGSAKPSVVTIDSSGTVLQEGYLNTNQFASPRYKGHYLGNGKIAFSQLSNCITIVDTLCNIIQSYDFSCGTYSTDIIQTNGGGYAITGLSSLGAPQGSKVFLTLLDSNLAPGAFNIELGIGGQNFTPIGVRQDSNGDFWLAYNGEGMSSGVLYPIVVKINPSGNVIWSNNYNPPSNTAPNISSMIATSDGGYLLTGEMSTAIDRMFVIKIDSSGSSSCNFTPYFITPQTLNIVPKTPHIPFTGTITAGTLNTPLVTNPVVNENILCLTTNITEAAASNNHYAIYPTLVSDGFQVVFEYPREQAHLTIYDLSGRIIMTKKVSNNERVICFQLLQGVYFVQITSLDRRLTSIQKIVKISN